MIEKYIMSENIIPDGILHDQDLYNVALDDDELTLSFNIKFYPNNYTDISLVQKYKDFKKCHIKCKLQDTLFCSAMLETSLNKNLEGKSKEISITEFVKIVKDDMQANHRKNANRWQYLYTYTSPNCHIAIIELSTYGIKYKRKTYSTCVLELNTDEIKYIWE
jgi:hypothetical protein